MASRTPYVGVEVAGDVLTASNFNKLPNGVFGYGEATSNQTGITTAADLTSLTTSVTPTTSTRLLVVAFHVTAQLTSGAGSGDTFGVTVLKDGSQIGEAIVQFPSGSRDTTITGFAVDVAPAASAHTYKLQGQHVGGTATYQITASATNPSWILVWDGGISF